ncbi:MAG: VWA domain-containing protein [Candidatus Acidiferrum sp.]
MTPFPGSAGDRATVVLALLLTPYALLSQNPPQAPPIHITTHLVQIGVIVRDSHGPVENLTKDDFSVFDRGKPQRISVFTAESAVSAPQPGSSQPLSQALAPNTFSDLPQYGTDKPRSVTIVLLDNLNTLSGNGHEGYETGPEWMEDLALTNAKAHLVEFVKNLDVKDRVAIYGLSDTLHVLCDFTSDRDRLLTILKNYDTRSKTNREAAEPGSYHTPVPGKEFNDEMDSQALEFAAATNERRAAQTMAALQSIASHVANIPGRKNLVWLTANLPFSGAALARILVPAQIAAYPVDARGLLPRAVPTSGDDVAGGGSELSSVLGLDGSPAQTDRPIGIDAMQKMAEVTGGRAFVNTNNITAAIRGAVEDSAVTYTLGFYIDSDSLDGKFHELKIQVHRSGVNLRYPKGYLALKDTSATQDERHNDYLVAVRSPLESSSIPVTIKVVRVEKPLPNCLSVFGLIDIHSLYLEQNASLRTGAVEVATIEQDETGKVLRQSASRINFNFTESKYSVYLKSGFPFHQFVQPVVGAITLRVVVEDPSTAQVGSLIIPLANVK